jgi:hydrogenase expression/formation protein HypD
VFLAVGFETTLPGIAAMLDEVERLRLPNVRILAGAKLIEPPLRALIAEGEIGVDGFLLPGHVSVILGSDFYAFLERDLAVPGVIAGFKPDDILLAVSRLVELALEGRASVENLYPRAVTAQGNPVARALLERWFEPEDSRWRGLGSIPLSGLRLRDEFLHRDANQLELQLDPTREPRGCRCGDVLKGKIEPHQCPLFDRSCTPLSPVGACMVSSEGTCAAWHRHERLEVAR